MAEGIRCADHTTPPTRKVVALSLPTSGEHGIVRLRTTATEFTLFIPKHGCWCRMRMRA
jgi:hypothetical protein